jgi:methyl-accepting chemotaxis protein
MSEYVNNELKTCPLCGNDLENLAVDSENLAFLLEKTQEGKLNDAISLARVVWKNMPQLRYAMDSELIKELSRTTLEDVQDRVNRVLEPMKTFIEAFPKLIEGLPESLRQDINERLDENRVALENEFRALRDLAPKSDEVTKTIQAVLSQIEDINKKKTEEMEQVLSERFRETLQRMSFPEPEQLKLLTQLIPATLPLLEELLRFQKVPSEKRALEIRRDSGHRG